MKVVFFTGAGVSAESGISTFRDTNGLWENHNVDDICNYHTWKKNKELVFEFYNQRRLQLATVKPNLIHTTIANLQKKYGKENIQIVTQNVDNLFEEAGCEDVLHVHGFLTEIQCTRCNHIFDIGYNNIKHDEKCPSCGYANHLKPNIIFFYESAPKYRDMNNIFNSLNDEKDLFIVIGTMGNVIPINSYVQTIYSEKILNNLEKNQYINEKYFQHVFYEKGTEAIQKIETIIENKINFKKEKNFVDKFKDIF